MTTQTSDPDKVAAIATMVALRGIAFQPSAYTVTMRARQHGVTPEGLVLRSEHINTQWGFGSGECPEPVVDMIETWYGEWQFLSSGTWHPVLWGLVHEYLLPVLGDDDVALHLLHTHYNPIRLAHPNRDRRPPLGRDVTVPWSTVLAHTILAIDAETAPAHA